MLCDYGHSRFFNERQNLDNIYEKSIELLITHSNTVFQNSEEFKALVKPQQQSPKTNLS
jgi:hypothetical protein